MEAETILIVDDDPLFRQTTEQQLVSLGFVTRTAETGAEATRAAESEDITLNSVRFASARYRWADHDTKLAKGRTSNGGSHDFG